MWLSALVSHVLMPSGEGLCPSTGPCAVPSCQQHPGWLGWSLARLVLSMCSPGAAEGHVGDPDWCCDAGLDPGKPHGDAACLGEAPHAGLMSVLNPVG